MYLVLVSRRRDEYIVMVAIVWDSEASPTSKFISYLRYLVSPVRECLGWEEISIKENGHTDANVCTIID